MNTMMSFFLNLYSVILGVFSVILFITTLGTNAYSVNNVDFNKYIALQLTAIGVWLALYALKNVSKRDFKVESVDKSK